MDKRTPLPTGSLIELNTGSVYRITDSPIGRGGGSLIYPAEKLISADGITQSDGFIYALKECFPSMGAAREADGSVLEITAETAG